MNSPGFTMMLLLLTMAVPVHASDQPGTYLGDLTWPEAEQRLASSPIVILPFGAGAKEHGRHIPMNADQVVLEYLLDVAVQNHDVVVAPAVLHGWLPAFRDFPGTEVADPGVFQDYMMEVAQSLVRNGAQRLIFLNTSITRASGLPLAIVAREIRVQHDIPTLVVSWDDLETPEIDALQEQRAGGHADEIETSINLYLQGDKVNMDLAEVDYGQRQAKDYAGYAPGELSRDPEEPAYSASGQYGDATLATPEKGKMALDIMTREWRRILAGFADRR